MLSLKNFLKNVRLPLLIDAIRWLLIDFYRRFRDGKDKRVYGVYVFCGLHGYGKTLSMVRWIKKEMKRVPDVRVYTNFHFVDQTDRITDWRQIIDIAQEGNAIIAIDEAHSSFNSRQWKDFPYELINEISQNRKSSVQFIMSAQVFDDLDKVIRTQTHYVVSCKNIGSRLMLNVFYRRPHYERSEDKRIVSYRNWFVASDALRESYDTMEKIKSLRDYKKQDTLRVEVSNQVVVKDQKKAR